MREHTVSMESINEKREDDVIMTKKEPAESFGKLAQSGLPP